jgi:hypothetical protein
MRIDIRLCLLCLLAMVVLANVPTRMVYFVEHEDEQEEDYIEIIVSVEAESRSLVSAISSAAKTVN